MVGSPARRRSVARNSALRLWVTILGAAALAPAPFVLALRSLGSKGGAGPLSAPSFSYTDARERRVDSSSLRGQAYVADFIFTSCTMKCPLLTARMVQIQRALSGAGIRFVSFSVDPEHDTPDVLASYAAR